MTTDYNAIRTNVELVLKALERDKLRPQQMSADDARKFAKQSEEIERQGRQAVGDLFVTLLSSIARIADSLGPVELFATEGTPADREGELQ